MYRCFRANLSRGGIFKLTDSTANKKSVEFRVYFFSGVGHVSITTIISLTVFNILFKTLFKTRIAGYCK